MSYQGKYEHRDNRGHQKRGRKRTMALLLALALLSATAVETLAYLSAKSTAITNTFSASTIPNEPVEKFENNVKSSIVVANQGDIAAYVRVKLVTYRVNDAGEAIGGAATIPSFTLGTGWFAQDGYYYYKNAVQPNASSGNLLGTSITLQQYTDADGGKQVIEVISESIQSVPASAVESAWSVTVTNGVLAKGGNA